MKAVVDRTIEGMNQRRKEVLSAHTLGVRLGRTFLPGTPCLGRNPSSCVGNVARDLTRAQDRSFRPEVRSAQPPSAMALYLRGPVSRSQWRIEMSMSVGSTTGFPNSFPTRSPATTTSQAKSAFTPTSASTDSTSSAPASSSWASDSFVDGIQVNLPNGFSVGVFRISRAPGGAQAPASGNGGSSAQMLQSVEQLVAAFANAPGAAANGAAPASPESLPAAANLAPGQSMDGIDVALPNGYSAEIYQIEQGSAGTASGSGGSADDRMVDTMEQLVANLSQYPATAASAYNKTVSAASPATAGVNSVA